MVTLAEEPETESRQDRIISGVARAVTGSPHGSTREAILFLLAIGSLIVAAQDPGEALVAVVGIAAIVLLIIGRTK